jgi:N-acyl-D-amino-acid deacylase
MGRAGSEKNRRYEGMRLSEIARALGDADPADTCLRLMAEDGGRISGIFHTMSEEDVRLVMTRPWVAIASDGSAINLDAPGFRIRGTTPRTRGCSREEFAADVVVFDPVAVAPTNSFEKPKAYAIGVRTALVNGVPVIDKGEHTGATPCMALLGPGAKRSAS